MLTNPIGAVFTPIAWAKWLITKFNLVKLWQDGAVICDPTAGEGVFVLALIEIAIQTGIDFSDRDLARIFLIDREPQFLKTFLQNFYALCDRPFPQSNAIAADVVLNPPPVTADLLFGNPPWVNFNNLPPDYKELLKPYYISAGLSSGAQNLLLGAARIDLAALVIVQTLKYLLTNHGEAFFFIPLSLFRGEQAHAGFRNYRLGQTRFQVRAIWELNQSKVFDVCTSYGIAHLQKGASPAFPIPYYLQSKGNWIEHQAYPCQQQSDPLIVQTIETSSELVRIRLCPDQKPRQGVNTCGTNSIFIFDRYPDFLPPELIYPLVTKEIFQFTRSPQKFILLPYDQESGQPLTEAVLRSNQNLWDYLNSHKQALLNRRGAMLRSQLQRGFWWSLLGVGKYNFSPYKVIWQAYGKSQFKPIVMSQHESQQWQANQAMQAFIPCHTKSDSDRIADELGNGKIEQYLLSMRIGGSCNWAQPGRISRFLEFI